MCIMKLNELQVLTLKALVQIVGSKLFKYTVIKLSTMSKQHLLCVLF